MALLLAATGLYFFANVQRVAIPGAIFNTLQSELDVSAAWITGLGAVFMYVYAINQLVIGFLAERYGGSRIILFGALVFCAGSILFPLSHGLFQLYLSRVLVGFGASSIYLSLVKETGRVFRGRHFPVALSVVIFVGYAGGIMANAPFVIGAGMIGWRNLLLLAGLCSAVCWLLFMGAGIVLKVPATRAKARFSVRPFVALLAKSNNRNLCLCAGINFGLYYVLQTVIGKKFLEDFCQMAPGSAAWILSLMGILSAMSGIFFAVLSRAFGNRKRVFIRLSGCVSAFVFTAMGCLILLDARSSFPAVLLCLLSMTASISSIAIPLLYQTNGPGEAGFSVCVLNFSFYFFVAIFGNGVGVLLNCFQPEMSGEFRVYTRGAWLAAFGMFFVFSWIASVFSFRVSEGRWGGGEGGGEPRVCRGVLRGGGGFRGRVLR